MLSTVIAASRLCPDGIEARHPILATNYPRELGGSKVKMWACTETYNLPNGPSLTAWRGGSPANATR
jgi:hypothetical protein